MIQITEYEIRSKKINHSVRFALLADIHDRPHDQIIVKLKTIKPDMILIPGDLAEKRVGLTDNLLKCLKKCVQIAPTYYSLGNHEMYLSSDDLTKAAETGAVVLDNTFTAVKGTDNILIGGMTSTAVLKAREGIYKKAYKSDLKLDWLKAFEQEKGFKILMSHHPEDYIPALKERNIDLVLSGHAHGGQVRLFGKALYAPNQGILPKYTEGMIDGKLIISRGLSNTGGLVPRVFNPRELVLCTIKGNKESI